MSAASPAGGSSSGELLNGHRHIEVVFEYLPQSLRRPRLLRQQSGVIERSLVRISYRSGEKYRFFIQYERKGAGEDAISARPARLLGLERRIAQSEDIPDEAALYYAGLLFAEDAVAQD